MKLTLTPEAVKRVKEVMAKQNPVPDRLRVAVIGGGCSGLQYHLDLEKATDTTVHKGDSDEIFEFDGLKVAVDQMSAMYLDGIVIDYLELVDGNTGFKFINPNVKAQCGCGSSFTV